MVKLGFSSHKNSNLAGIIEWTSSGFAAHFKASAKFGALMDISSDFASSKRWTTSSGISANNSSDLGFRFNHHFAESNNLSDLAGTIEWTLSSGFAAHFGVSARIRALTNNSSDLGSRYNHHFAQSNNISELTGSKGWTSSSGFFAYKNSDMLSRIQPQNYNLPNYRYSVTSLRGRVLLFASTKFT